MSVVMEGVELGPNTEPTPGGKFERLFLYIREPRILEDGTACAYATVEDARNIIVELQREIEKIEGRG